MVKQKTIILITTLISMIAASVYAHDIAVENADGVTLYYNIINDGKELEVTFQSGPGEYHLNTIVTVIPEEVTYNSVTRKVTRIGKNAFNSEFELPSVTIPNSVTSIGYNAFNDIDLKSVISLIKEPFVVDESIFSSNTFNTATLYVPKGNEDMYKKTNGWKKFLHIEEGTAGINSIIMDEDKNARIYDLFGRRLEKPQKGINIIGGKNILVK